MSNEMVLELGGISATSFGVALPRYCRHWSRGVYSTYFGALPTTYTGTPPCETLVPLRAKGQRHLMRCACGKYQIRRPE